MTQPQLAVRSRHFPVRPEWLRLRQEAALEPALPIIDPHHHLWDHPENRYLLPELLEDLGQGHNIVSTVFVDCRSMYKADGDPAFRPVGETEFVNGIAAMSASGGYGKTRICEGIVSYADLNLGARAREVLEALIHAGCGRFRGVRNISAWHPDPNVRGTAAKPAQDVLTRPSFREGFACLAPLGLTFDAWMYHTQLPEVVALARAFPGTTIILDHMGGTIGIGPFEGRREETFAEWKKSLRDVASCPNVVLKVGGMGMRIFGFKVHEGELPPTGEELAAAWKPYVEAGIEAFGPNRCMFESNFPVDKGSCSYGALWNAFKIIAKGYSAAEKSALFSGTAARVYRLRPVASAL